MENKANEFEWWDFPANPIQVSLKDRPDVKTYLCTRVSPACGKGDCWAEATQNRFKKGKIGPLPYLKESWDKVNISVNQKILDSLVRRSRDIGEGKPQTCFLENLSDIFHEQYKKRSTEILDPVFDVIDKTPNIIYFALTKRPQYAEKYLQNRYKSNGYPPNLYPGFTAENQQYFDVRWSYMREIAHRASCVFVSYEPALGPLKLPWDFLLGRRRRWIIAGGKSGGKFEDVENEKPIHYYSSPTWFRDIRDQCEANDINFFFKQYGTYGPVVSGDDKDRRPTKWICTDGRVVDDEEIALADGGSWSGLIRLGKKKAGRTIDGDTYDEIPINDAHSTGFLRR